MLVDLNFMLINIKVIFPFRVLFFLPPGAPLQSFYEKTEYIFTDYSFRFPGDVINDE
jgi:hypothetical protein